MNILADASLAYLKKAFPEPFRVTLYHRPDEVSKLLQDQEILLCRSTLKIDKDLLGANPTLRYIATASSGTDHIDKDYLNRHQIKLLDAKGSNAAAVADYVIATLAFLQKYNRFGGTKAGIIGVGRVGSEVVNRLRATQMEVICYDPLRAMIDTHFTSCSLEDLFACDLLCIHANLHNGPFFPSLNFFDETRLQNLKAGCVIINASRGSIVNEAALLKHKQPFVYCTDVFTNEPQINKNIIDYAALCTPHIAGHSIEAKFSAIAMLSEQLHLCYQLPTPLLQPPTPSAFFTAAKSQSWHDIILSLYNPANETKLLKSALNIKSAFLLQRQLHQNRHDFAALVSTKNDEQIRKIVGQYSAEKARFAKSFSKRSDLQIS